METKETIEITDLSLTEDQQVAVKAGAGLAKVGVGHLILSNANTYAGQTTVNQVTERTGNLTYSGESGGINE